MTTWLAGTRKVKPIIWILMQQDMMSISWTAQWTIKNYKNRLRLAKVIVKNKMLRFLWFSVYMQIICTSLQPEWQIIMSAPRQSIFMSRILLLMPNRQIAEVIWLCLRLGENSYLCLIVFHLLSLGIPLLVLSCSSMLILKNFRVARNHVWNEIKLFYSLE